MLVKKICLKIILPLAVGFGFFWSGSSALALEACNNQQAEWNIGINPRFSCHCVDDTACIYPYKNCSNDRKFYTILKQGRADCRNACANQNCTTNLNDGKIFHCRCVREADCTDIGGRCISLGDETPPRGWQRTYFHCPFMEDVVCYVPPEPDEPVGGDNDTPVTPIDDTTNTPIDDTNQTDTPILTPFESTPVSTGITTTGLDLDPTQCCRQIVPRINYETELYGLNHLVQVAVNIYECILCIVGSLILLMLVVGGVILITSAGNDTQVGLGRKIISGAVIGGIIVFASFLIVNFTVKALGASFSDEPKIQISPGK